MSSSALKTILAYKFEVVSGPHSGQKFSFEKAVISIGREIGNDIILNEDPKVSRQHLEIRYSNGEFRAVNLSQKNFTLVNGRKSDNAALNYGDKIQVGETEIVFSLNQPAQPQSVLKPSLSPVKSPASMAPRPVMRPQMAPPMHPPMPPPSYGGPASSRPGPSVGGDSGKTRFYIILGVVGFLGYLLFSSGGKKKEEVIRFDAPPTMHQELINAENLKKDLEDKKARMGTLQAQRAEENFIKGFRDFRQAQYGRARDSFQVVLTLSPEHQEARRYLTLSKLKFDEQVKQFIQQGRINLDNRNYRLCKSNFLTVMTMLNQNQNDQNFLDAKKLYDVCDLALGGR